MMTALVSPVKRFFTSETGGVVTLVRLGRLLQERRGTRGIREVADEIGISAPTLSRVERGKLPDLHTFEKICVWLRVDPKEFLNMPNDGTKPVIQPGTTGVAVHFRADRLLSPDAASDFAKLILVAQEDVVSNG